MTALAQTGCRSYQRVAQDMPSEMSWGMSLDLLSHPTAEIPHCLVVRHKSRGLGVNGARRVRHYSLKAPIPHMTTDHLLSGSQLAAPLKHLPELRDGDTDEAREGHRFAIGQGGALRKEPIPCASHPDATLQRLGNGFGL